MVEKTDTNKFDNIRNYYNKLVSIYGNDHKSADYGRAESQSIKFKVLAQVLPDLSNKTILDIGCGLADYATFTGCKSYTGIDLSEKMIETAKKTYPNLSLHCGNFLEHNFKQQFDIVNANGIFYLLGNNAEETMYRLIRKMVELSKSVVAFNSLSTLALKKEEGEFYADPSATLKFCQTLSPYVTLRHDYLPHDFTIYIYKDQNI